MSLCFHFFRQRTVYRRLNDVLKGTGLPADETDLVTSIVTGEMLGQNYTAQTVGAHKHATSVQVFGIRTGPVLVTVLCHMDRL